MKKNQPLVSIIIVTWNRKNDILDALDAIKSPQIGLDVQISSRLLG